MNYDFNDYFFHAFMNIDMLKADVPEEKKLNNFGFVYFCVGIRFQWRPWIRYFWWFVWLIKQMLDSIWRSIHHIYLDKFQIIRCQRR